MQHRPNVASPDLQEISESWYANDIINVLKVIDCFYIVKSNKNGIK